MTTLGATRLCDLGLTIAGSPLEPVLARLDGELAAAGVQVRPHHYLSDEWGVPFGSISLGIPFYLARADLLAHHAARGGFVEGGSPAELLRYLRHEVAHVVNYAYRLYDRPEWVQHFGAITQPYVEDYRPQPFSRRFVRHLPGWYAQMHPDEDWAETFAVWLTPRSEVTDWRRDYAGWAALAKLEYVDQLMAELAGRQPLVTLVDDDEAVGTLEYTVDEYYEDDDGEDEAEGEDEDEAEGADEDEAEGADEGEDEDELPAGVDGNLRAVFEDAGSHESASQAARLPAGELIRRLGPALMADVYRWTGHFPERTRDLVDHLAERADALAQVYPADAETRAVTAVTTLVTALAMNHVLKGRYSP